VQRFGKSALTLARCQGVDQSKYDPIFAQASAVLANYRHALKLRSALASELAWISGAPKHPTTETRRH
jgi:hypothetical protein